MGRYVRVSGVVFMVMALVQLARTVLGWPIEVDGVSIPMWVSGLAFGITSTFAVWAFRTAKGAA